MSELLGYEELSELTGRSVGALRVARSKGRLPDQDAPGPKWRRATVAAFLAEGARVPSAADAAQPAAVPAADRSEAPAVRPTTPESSTGRTEPPAASCPHPKAERVVRPWGAFCQACGRLLR